MTVAIVTTKEITTDDFKWENADLQTSEQAKRPTQAQRGGWLPRGSELVGFLGVSCWYLHILFHGARDCSPGPPAASTSCDLLLRKCPGHLTCNPLAEGTNVL